MSLRTALKNKNRTLLELRSGILFLGILGLAVTALIDVLMKTGSLWICFSWFIGIMTAYVSATDMYNVLDKALDLPENKARKKIYFGYLKRYVILGIMIAITCISDKLNPIAFFAAYMSLKISAYMQPLTHKLYNSYFHETDPVSISQEEYDALHPEIAERFKGESTTEGNTKN